MLIGDGAVASVTDVVTLFQVSWITLELEDLEVIEG